MDSTKKPSTDVVELCAILQSLGYNIKSLDTDDVNISQDEALAVRTVVVNCQTSGLHVVLENGTASCSCPAFTNPENSGVWQVSGVTGGKQLSKESGSSLLGSLPKTQRERLAKNLQDMMKNIREMNESNSNMNVSREHNTNKSNSMVELKSPERGQLMLPSETPTRYRSLDTLTAAKGSQQLPEPGQLKKINYDTPSDDKIGVREMCQRQSTYTIATLPSSGSGSFKKSNKTSSPIQSSHNNFMERLVEAEKVAETLRYQLSALIKQFADVEKDDSSVSSLALDVSKISVLKGDNLKTQFASSPTISGIGLVQEDISKSRIKRTDSASTSNIGPPKSEGKISKLRRISPMNIFKRKETTDDKSDKTKTQEAKNKTNILKSKIVTPVRTPKSNLESTSSFSSSKKKFSHIKSTIPRPSASKKD